ncbi:MAG: hypothetical protein AAGA29_13450 [Planctomycetota bacterium]
MRRAITPVLALLLVLMNAGVARAQGAADLIGEWHVESYNGDTPADNVQMKLVFVDADTMTMVLLIDGEEVSSQDVRYEATDDGVFVRYSEDAPDGAAATWSIDADGKLHLATDDGSEEIVLTRL